MATALLPLLLLLQLSHHWAAPAALSASSRGSPPVAAEGLQAELTAAIEAGQPSFTIKGGTYRFKSGTSLLIHNATDLAIRAPDPVELIFEGSAGVSFVSAVRVSIENIAIDYDPLPTKG